MFWLTLCFWASAGVVVYAYALYPVLVAVSARVRGRSVRTAPWRSSFTVIITAFNERARIRARVRELLDLIATSGPEGELIVVSDGSTDGTAAAAREEARPNLTVIELERNVGKAAALTKASAAARGEILVFGDVRQSWDSDALGQLLENFSDPAVGGVSGELLLESAPGVVAGLGLYWRYEKWIRRNESRIHSSVGVTGAICAVRRELFRAIPTGTILDDVYWPLCVIMQGSRVVHEERARARDRLPERAQDEMRRKVRTLCGNFQLLARLSSSLLPWRNPVWIQFISHKILRLLVPWALMALLVSSVFLRSPVYRGALFAQLAFYGVALAGTHRRVAARFSAASAASAFVVLNAAAIVGFWVWVTGRAEVSWRKVSYTHARDPLPAVHAAAGGS